MNNIKFYIKIALFIVQTIYVFEYKECVCVCVKKIMQWEGYTGLIVFVLCWIPDYYHTRFFRI